MAARHCHRRRMTTTRFRRSLALGASLLLAGGLAATTTLPAAAARGCTGSSIRGDVNGDNRGEVAVTQIGRGGLSGAVHLFYGTSGGLVTDATGAARDDQFIDQSTPLVPGTPEPGDEFGAATVFGDFDVDGCADLAVGSPGEDSGVGALTILYGSPQGLAATSAQRLSFADLFGRPSVNGRFGAELEIGDFNHDSVDDLAVAAPELVVDGHVESGGVAVVYGNEEGGLNAGTGADLLTRSTPGIPGNAAPNDYFGSTLSAGDFNGNGVDQLAIVSLASAYRDRLAAVQVVERGPSGYTGTAITQQAAQGHGQSRPEDDFGVSAAAGTFNSDQYADLALGAPGRGCLECDEEYGYGEVIVLLGSARRTHDERAAAVHPELGRASPAPLLPATVSASHWPPALCAATSTTTWPSGRPRTTSYTGSVTVLKGGSSGLTGTGSTIFTQATPGIGGAPGPHSFGGTMAVAAVQSGALPNLIIGADSQVVDGVRATGLINQLAATTGGPRAAGSRTLHLDTAGVKGQPEEYAQFGFELS